MLIVAPQADNIGVEFDPRPSSWHAGHHCGALHFSHRATATRFRQPLSRLISSALAPEIPPITTALPLTEAHAPPCAQASPPVAVCCTPCTNTLPKLPDRTSHGAPAQTRAPECRTLTTSAGRVRSMQAPGIHLNLRLHPVHPRAAAPATSPNSAVLHGTSQSTLTVVVDTLRRAALCNY